MDSENLAAPTSGVDDTTKPHTSRKLNDENPSLDRLLSSEIVELRVGKEAKLFRAHKDVLCARSPFFKACLTSGMAESKDLKISLANDDPEALAYTLRWIYESRVDFKGSQKPTMAAARTWIVADRFCMEACKNDVMDRLKAGASYNKFGGKLLVFVSRQGVSSSTLGRFLRRRPAYGLLAGKCIAGEKETVGRLMKNGMRDEIGELVAEMAALHRKRELQSPKDDADCEWHDHSETPKCKAGYKNERV